MALTTTTNPLVDVLDFGQSIWYDNIRRGLIDSGELQRMVDDDGLRGVTSNPAIFEKAVAGSSDYAAAIAELSEQGLTDPKAIFERLAIRDVQDAADILRPVYQATGRRDGYVSLEVSPNLAHDTEGTVAEAVRLWGAVDRPNLMIKVPATDEGIAAVERLIGMGININVTLLFAAAPYRQVADAFMSGLETFAAAGGDLGAVASVASFFVSRIDATVDVRLAEVAARAETAEQRSLAVEHMGRVAIANARLTYQLYKSICGGPRWAALAARGAQTQRLLFASTGTKNPKYSDVVYVEELIGPETVDTVPPATFDAFRDHGRAAARLESGVEDAEAVMATLARLGISFDEITEALLADGLELFVKAFETLLDAIATVAGTEVPGTAPSLSAALPGDLGAEVEATIAAWQETGKVRRLWARDATLWTGGDEARWLGWLGIAAEQLAHPEELQRVAADIRTAGFSDALLLGMGGSSLCPEMLSLTFGSAPGHPQLHVLDSTDPAQVEAVEEAIDIGDTVFIVSSKSGATLEPNIFHQYFFDKVERLVGAEEAGRRFIAVTDPGSAIEAVARAAGFRYVAHGVASIGGRYSALSNFGMVPGAIMGVDVHELLDRAERMAQGCVSCVPAAGNPAVRLGAIIGVCHNRGRDKLTLITSAAIADFGAWLEQLLAESTGKQGRGVIPVDREPLGPPGDYGDDRLFVHVRLGDDAAQDHAVAALEAAGHPVVRIRLGDSYDLGGEIFRWEFATAVAGAIIGINPFDQPDVEAAKVATRELTAEYERTGSLPAETPVFRAEGLELYTDAVNAAALAETSPASFSDYLSAHLARIGPGDYLALLAFVPMTAAHAAALDEIRRIVRDRRHIATCAGFGPRFLHSTGQAYKGGPNRAVVIQITCDDAFDLPIPGRRYTFGVVKAAQARGDFLVLAERGRRVLRVHLVAGVAAGLAVLRSAVEQTVA